MELAVISDIHGSLLAVDHDHPHPWCLKLAQKAPPGF